MHSSCDSQEVNTFFVHDLEAMRAFCRAQLYNTMLDHVAHTAIQVEIDAISRGLSGMARSVEAGVAPASRDETLNLRISEFMGAAWEIDRTTAHMQCGKRHHATLWDIRGWCDDPPSKHASIASSASGSSVLSQDSTEFA